ncbi:MAG: cobalamin-dependent protein, partial [Polyangiaceae bacterium]|nr:cobalamin-dependent protein [Polyangiaceae bacterium]
MAPLRKLRLLLVQPRFDNPELDRNKGTIPPVGLAYLAAYTPPGWTIEVIDEQVERTRYPDADLVGISTTTITINRAYEIAQHYRSRGCPVVLGGVHASVLPQEAEGRADSVVI